MGWDVDRSAWRTFRVDRLELRRTLGPRFVPRELPEDGDVARFVDRGVGAATWEVRARVRVAASAGWLRERLPPAIRVVREGDGAGVGWCEIEVGSDTPELLAVHLGMLGVDFQVTGPPELVTAVGDLADRYRRALPGDAAG